MAYCACEIHKYQKHTVLYTSANLASAFNTAAVRNQEFPSQQIRPFSYTKFQLGESTETVLIQAKK